MAITETEKAEWSERPMENNDIFLSFSMQQRTFSCMWAARSLPATLDKSNYNIEKQTNKQKKKDIFR